MKEIGEQKLQLLLLQMNYTNVGSIVMLIALSVDGIVFRTLTLVKDFRQIEFLPKKREKRIQHQCDIYM